MSARSSPLFGGGGNDEKHVGTTEALYEDVVSLGSSSEKEVFSLESVDPALNAKMHLVNDV
jgi:hypothetical protein